jgi:peptidyl-prolyl cis-trans isomerase C
MQTTLAATGDEENREAVKEKKVVAKVNGQPVYEDQLTEAVNKSMKKWKKYGMKQPTPALTYKFQSRALNEVIDEELIIQAAQKVTVTELDKRVEAKLQKMKRKYKTKEQFEDHLKRKNLTLEKLKANLAQQAHIDEYLKKQGITNPEIPEETIRAFYDSNPENYQRKETTIQVSHILIKIDQTAGPEEKEKAYLKAEEIRKEIIGGKDFAEMAKEYSQCNSASGGGSLRYIEKGYMPKEFDEVAFSIEKDKISGIVETKFGYHIIKVTDKKPAGLAPYDEVRSLIKKYLQLDETKKRLAEHTAILKDKATIEIFLKDPDKKE